MKSPSRTINTVRREKEKEERTKERKEEREREKKERKRRREKKKRVNQTVFSIGRGSGGSYFRERWKKKVLENLVFFFLLSSPLSLSLLSVMMRE